MIKIKKNLNILTNTIKIIENINTEVDFVFCSEGIIVKAIDPSAISIAIFRIKKEMFEEYEVTTQKVCTFQVNIISKILKKIGTKELLISFEEDKVNFVSSKDEFSLKFFVGNEDTRPEPSIEGTSQWNIKSKDFFILVKDFAEFNEILKCESKDDKLYIGTKSNILEGKSLTNSEIILADDSSCWYSLPNFIMINNIKNIFDVLKFDFSTNNPCMITAENEHLKFKWVLAPRIEE